ncbi:MAG: endonuclease III [Elusimicrobiota bacterium]
MNEQKKLNEIIKILRKLYPGARTALSHHDPFQLLVATVLSAQCTDERVNMVTPVLFKKYPKPENLAMADIKDIENIVRSTGFYKNKALSIKESSKTIVEQFNGKVPKTMEELMTLRGVARKTANVVLGSAYGIPSGIVVDTHVKRLAFRLGFTKETDPFKIEQDLMKILDKKDWIWFAHALIWHGRKVCIARNPLCSGCKLNGVCDKNRI